MAALPAFGGDVAEFTASYGDYASPWLSFAEKAIRKDGALGRDDYLLAIGNTVGTASDAFIGNESGTLLSSLKRAGSKTLISGALYRNSESAGEQYFAQSIGQEVGGLASAAVGSLLPNIQRDTKEPIKPWERGRQVALAGVSQAVSAYTSNRINGMNNNDALVSSRYGLQSGFCRSLVLTCVT